MLTGGAFRSLAIKITHDSILTIIRPKTNEKMQQMPLQPLRFDTYENARKSLVRLKARHLIQSVKTKDGTGACYQVTPQAALADELLVSLAGNTYLLSDVLVLSEAEAAAEEVVFVSTLADNQHVADIQKEAGQNLIRNKPLAHALATMKLYREDFTVEIPDKTSIIFPLPSIVPVITSKETTQESFAAEKYLSYMKRKSASKPFSIAARNNALGELFFNARKNREQLAYLQSGASIVEFPKVNLDRAGKYRELTATYPEICSASIDRLFCMLANIDSLIRELESQKAWYQKNADLISFKGSLANIVASSLFYSAIVVVSALIVDGRHSVARYLGAGLGVGAGVTAIGLLSTDPPNYVGYHTINNWIKQSHESNLSAERDVVTLLKSLKSDAALFQEYVADRCKEETYSIYQLRRVALLHVEQQARPEAPASASTGRQFEQELTQRASGMAGLFGRRSVINYDSEDYYDHRSNGSRRSFRG